MKRDELIVKTSEQYADNIYDRSSEDSMEISHSILWTNRNHNFKAGINSQLNKDLTELAVIDGRISENKSILKMAELHMDERSCVVLKQVIFTLETQRTDLLTKLNLEG